jgi:formamidopyrimidine-DNA glycosylase
VPELPDVTVYCEALERRIVGQRLLGVLVVSPFVLRTVEPSIATLIEQPVLGVRRLGKRLVFTFPGELHLVLHLMIAGRLQWHEKPPTVNRRLMLALFTFARGTLVLTEAGSKRRASLYVVHSDAALREHDRGGLEVLSATLAEFSARLRSENHTMKRSLADPRLFSGIGNAYSDEILHRARLGPLTLTSKLTDEEITRLFDATRTVLTEWTDRLRREAGEGFPGKVTAFRPEMAVHGKFREPCPVCGSPVQRIKYADNETDYCATCQTGGRLLADRGMSRLLKQDWPRSLDELEERLSR